MVSLQQENNKRLKLNIIRNMVNEGQYTRQYNHKIHCVQDKRRWNEQEKEMKTYKEEAIKKPPSAHSISRTR